MANKFQEKASFIWNQADLLRGPYQPNEYRKVILPFTVLKRFDSLLEFSKKDVVESYDKYKDEFDDVDHALKEKAVDIDGKKLGFYNKSKYDFRNLLEDPENIEQNVIHYIDGFSENVRKIFGEDGFNVKLEIAKLAKHNLLFLLIKKYCDSKLDLHPYKVDNDDMGNIFQELVRRFAETSNQEAGDHFTPPEVVELMTRLLFASDQINLKEKNKIFTVYDQACGTGGMLIGAKKYIRKENEKADVVLHGQELNPEIWAICESEMLMYGDANAKIVGPTSTMSHDGFSENKYDFMISNPPYGVKWEADKKSVDAEAEKGEEGRFEAGTPRINDGQLLFLLNPISKMKRGELSRISIITNGSPLFTGDAGSGESDIRRWLIENDFIEAVIAMPEQMFYKTGITTYVWILSNKKPTERVGKIQLIDGSSFYKKMIKNLGKKRYTLGEKDINKIVELYLSNEKSSHCKIFENENFGYSKIVVERPKQYNYQVTDERLENLYTYSTFVKIAESKKVDPAEKLEEEEKGKEKQKQIIAALKKIGHVQYKNWVQFEEKVKEALKPYKLNGNFTQNIILCLAEFDEDAEYVKDTKGRLQADSNLRDNEKITLKQDIDEHFDKEVRPYYGNAWMDRKKDKIGYAVNFKQYFYKYVPPRSLENIEEDIEKVTGEIKLLTEEEVK